eukprot:5621622-Karenia_brevis.AAC.1
MQLSCCICILQWGGHASTRCKESCLQSYDQLMVACAIKVIQTKLQVGLMRHCIRGYDEVQLNLLHDEFRTLKVKDPREEDHAFLEFVELLQSAATQQVLDEYKKYHLNRVP